MDKHECDHAGRYWICARCYNGMIASRAALLEALERLVRFSEELCADVNVSSHYPSIDRARAAIHAAKGETS